MIATRVGERSELVARMIPQVPSSSATVGGTHCADLTSLVTSCNDVRIFRNSFDKLVGDPIAFKHGQWKHSELLPHMCPIDREDFLIAPEELSQLLIK